MPPPRDDLAELIRCLPSQTILNVARLCDGHTILPPERLIDAGLPNEVVAAVTTTYRSDTTSPKTTIFVDGQPVEQIRGIYSLDLLQRLAGALGVTYRECYGRGSQATAIREAVYEHFEAQ